MSSRHLTALVPWLLFLAQTGNAYAADTITAPPGRFHVDQVLHLIVTDLGVEQVNTQQPGLKSTFGADAWYAFNPPVAEVALGSAFPVTAADGTPFQLFFTALPLIGITTTAPIVDEPKVPGAFILSDGSGLLTQASLGIEFRGSSSQFLPKLSFLIEFRSDTAWEEETDVELLGMRNDDDWNLQALYNEPLRLRSVVNNRLWRMIHTPYYQFIEPDAVTGVSMQHAELFVNGSYRGIYAVSERVDRKQLQLKDYNGTIRGELFKGVSWGASTFSEAPPYNNTNDIWSGFEHEYPKEVTDWSSLHAFVAFVVNASTTEFLNQYPAQFEQDNAVDYFLFLNLLWATDNTGKNIYVARYDAGTPYFYVPYDLDGTFGVMWDGAQQNITDSLLTNGFYDRLLHDCGPGGFMERLQQRWNTLRTDIITQDHLTGLFAQEHNRLVANGAYTREMLAWPDYAHDTGQLTYLSNWLSAHLAFLDARFNAPCDPVGISENSAPICTFQPNPATDRITVVLTDESPATFNLTDGMGRTVLQQALRNGRNTISLEHLSGGLYLVRVAQHGRATTGRLVIN
ncbi:MAG: CotH kinase family protein [Flavobacteriales bacterium]|nr:CotH kinase family protein [Flavobacteriales bacterium]